MNTYKYMLIEKLKNYINLQKEEREEKARYIVEKILPDENFYCFDEPDHDDSDYDRKIEKEIKDIDKLL